MEENQFEYSKDHREPDPLWQMFNIGMGFFLVGIGVRISARFLHPTMSLSLEPRSSFDTGWYETGVILASWLLGLGSSLTAISCVFICFRALKR